MKKMICILAILLGLGGLPEAMAQETKGSISGVSVDGFNMERNGKFLTVEMGVDLTALHVDKNQAVLLTPRLANGTDSLDLPSIGIYGRSRYYYYVRNGIGSISGEDEMTYRASEKPARIDYHTSVSYQEWMDGATLTFHRSDWGCCQEILAEYEGQWLGKHRDAFFPELVFVRPEAERVKSRALSGSAFIDFPVNQTVIYPEYRRNAVELGKIEATIDSVRSDKDVAITSVWLKGYASPESPYSHNKQLAIGRTEALKRHIDRLYRFDEQVVTTDYEPEDWAGLRRYVEQSNLEHRQEILALIDSDTEPDAKELKIKSTYPEEYRFLLQHCYPALRHTDYRIAYNIRSYNDVAEIRQVMNERPQKLSLNEFYLVAQEYEPGTEEFTEVFETAVRMYPTDETANLNAANAAMRRGENGKAAAYLAKAGNSPEAVYARGALAVRTKDYATARKYLDEAQKLGLEKAADTLQEMARRGQ